MLCRRCGMESTTTDICEWCKKPMLPAGTVVSGGKEERDRNGQPQDGPRSQVQVAGSATASEGLPGLGDEIAPENSQEAEEELRPLGGEAAKPKLRPGVPSHGLSDDATRTSVDLADYLGPDQSLFRPLARAEHTATMDPLAHRRIARGPLKPVSDIPDNVRLLRSLIAGLAVFLPIAVIEFALFKHVPDKVFVIPLIRGGDSLVAALLWGIVSGGFVGGGVGALLVNFKKGPFVGLVIGLVLGKFTLATEPVYFGIIAAALTGIIVGRIATVGYRRPVSV
jgi:hypothetical protein